MPNTIGQIGMSAANAATGGLVQTGLGLLLEKHNDKRQLNQQGKLLQQQFGIDKQMMDYQQRKQLETFEATSYPKQLELMKEAGLSPGLMYGMGGPGGATTGAGAASVNASKAPAGGGEIMGLQLMQAQKNLIEAQTEKTKVEAEKTAGVDTEQAKQQAGLTEIQKNLASETYWDTARKIQAEAEKTMAETRAANLKADLAGETFWIDKSAAEAELIGLRIANQLKRTEIELTEEKVNQIVESVKQGWENLSIQRGKLNLDKFIHDISDSTKLAAEMIEGIVGSVLSKKPATKIYNQKTTNQHDHWH